MKNKFLFSATILMFLAWIPVLAQETVGELRLSLAEAREFAIQHNRMVTSAKLDMEASKMVVWEAVSAGLPQVVTSGSFTDNLKQMVFLIPDFIGGDPNRKIPITMGSQYSTSLSLQASMPLFSAPYIVGIETTKLARRITETSYKSTELDVQEAVSSIYYLILISEESLKILEWNLANLQEVLLSTKTMYNVGMAESTDVDQMASNVTMMENSKSSLERTIEMNYNLLRFQLGVSSDTRIVLSNTLEDLAREINIDALLTQEFDHRENVGYRLAEGQEKMAYMNLKSQKAQVLPTLSGVISTTKTGMGDTLSMMGWYNSSLVGLQLSIPLFASGNKYAKIKKARINLEKAINQKEMVTDQLKLQEKQLRYNLVNANTQYKNQKDNVEVSRRVYTSMENKYKQGMASSLDLTQANQQYLQAENNYISSLMNLLQTKLALDKLLNNM